MAYSRARIVVRRSRTRAPDGSRGRIASSILAAVTSASGMQRIDHGPKGDTGAASGRIAKWSERWSRRFRKCCFREDEPPPAKSFSPSIGLLQRRESDDCLLRYTYTTARLFCSCRAQLEKRTSRTRVSKSRGPAALSAAIQHLIPCEQFALPTS